MAILFYSESDAPQPWREAFARWLPDIEFRLWPDVGNPDDIRYALVWKPRPGLLKSLPKLKAILSLGAGVDHVVEDPQWPQEVPLVRLVDAGLAQQMSEYALYGVLHFHLHMDRYADQQRRGEWRLVPAVLAPQRTVGVMGLGVLGGDFVRKLVPLRFRVLGWSRTLKTLSGVETFHGPDGLAAFLGQTQILVNFLPLTSHTAGILNRNLFARLPRGACIVNLARGAHLDESDLIAALDDGQIGGSMLDVFQREPLPPAHPLWRHPRVFVTPHMAGQVTAELAVSQVIENIVRIERGEAPLGLVDPARGY